MKIRGLIIAAVVFFALYGLLYWSEHRKPESTAKAADAPPAILKLDENAITKLEIEKRDAPPVELVKSGDDWQITSPQKLRADQSAVSGLLSTVSSLTSERLVEEKAGDLKPYGLDRPDVEVEITGKDINGKKLLIGDETPASGAVYAMVAGEPRVFTVASYIRSSVDKSVNDLRDKRLLTVASDKVSRIELLRRGQAIEFGRSKDDWQILKPKPLRADNSQVSELARKLSDATMDLSGADESAAAAAYSHGTPVATARVTDPSGTQELTVRKSNDNYYAKSSVAEGTYKIDSDLGRSLDKGLEDFRNKKLFDFGFSTPSKVELRMGPKAYFLAKGGEDWWSNGKKMDGATVQAFLSKLRELGASKFPDSGFSNPTIQTMVTSDDGKRVERVAISKSGSAYVAKRENEPGLYQLDSSAIDELQKAADGLKPAGTSAK